MQPLRNIIAANAVNFIARILCLLQIIGRLDCRLGFGRLRAVAPPGKPCNRNRDYARQRCPHGRRDSVDDYGNHVAQPLRLAIV